MHPRQRVNVCERMMLAGVCIAGARNGSPMRNVPSADGRRAAIAAAKTTWKLRYSA